MSNMDYVVPWGTGCGGRRMVHNAQMRRSTAELNPLALASFVMAILGFVALPVVGAALAIVLATLGTICWLIRARTLARGTFQLILPVLLLKTR